MEISSLIGPFQSWSIVIGSTMYGTNNTNVSALYNKDGNKNFTLYFIFLKERTEQ